MYGTTTTPNQNVRTLPRKEKSKQIPYCSIRSFMLRLSLLYNRKTTFIPHENARRSSNKKGERLNDPTNRKLWRVPPPKNKTKQKMSDPTNPEKVRYPPRLVMYNRKLAFLSPDVLSFLDRFSIFSFLFLLKIFCAFLEWTTKRMYVSRSIYTYLGCVWWTIWCWIWFLGSIVTRNGQ